MSDRGSGEPVTLREVARAADVTPGTASRALDPDKQGLVSEATRARVREAADELGYRANLTARNLRKGRSGTIGVVVADLGNPFIAPLLRGVENAAEAKDLMPLIAESQDRHARLRRVLDHLVARRADVAIVTAARLGDADALAEAAERLPIVLAVRALPDPRFPSVSHDDGDGGRMAARHLLDLGHTKLVQLPGPTDVSSFLARDAGFRAELGAAGIDPLVIPEPASAVTTAEGRRLMTEVLATGARPTAVFAHNDPMAVGAIDALAEAGLRCPDDVSVVGYNDSALADHVSPPLTTVRFPAYEIGRLAAELAISLAEHPDAPPLNLSLPPTLVVRGSTAPPPRP